tara:strand:+ start:492 stop:1067 length:576 start_codon:yes stop_codon:yes gene_type:complete
MTSKLKTDVLEAVSGSATIALTNQLSGMTSASVPSGSVLQVVSYFTAAKVSQTIGTTDTIVNSMTKAITPLGANSKFLVQVRWFGEINIVRNRVFNIHMDGARVNSQSNNFWSGLSMGSLTYHNSNGSSPEMVHLSTLVTTSSAVGTDITFSFVTSTYANNVIWSNRCFSNVGSSQYEDGTSELIITEIKG